MEMTAVALDAALDKALFSTRFIPAQPFRRRRDALGLTGQIVVIGGLSFTAEHFDPDKGWVFTRRQVKRMKRALQPILAGHEQPLANLVLALREYGTAE